MDRVHAAGIWSPRRTRTDAQFPAKNRALEVMRDRGRRRPASAYICRCRLSLGIVCTDCRSRPFSTDKKQDLVRDRCGENGGRHCWSCTRRVTDQISPPVHAELKWKNSYSDAEVSETGKQNSGLKSRFHCLSHRRASTWSELRVCDQISPSQSSIWRIFPCQMTVKHLKPTGKLLQGCCVPVCCTCTPCVQPSI